MLDLFCVCLLLGEIPDSLLGGELELHQVVGEVAGGEGHRRKMGAVGEGEVALACWVCSAVPVLRWVFFVFSFSARGEEMEDRRELFLSRCWMLDAGGV